jgi:hypothetical protein
MTLLTVGCIDPILIVMEEGVGTLVVDGTVTDQPGPHVIKLSRSINFDNTRVLRVYPVPEQNATVTVSNNHGVTVTAHEIQPGSYQLDMQGVPGDTYELRIQTADGKNYVSEQETMEPVQDVERIEFELKFYDQLFINANGNARVLSIDAFFIYAIVNDPSEHRNFYRWQSDGIFEFFSLTDNPNIRQCWAPVSRLESKIEIAADSHMNGKMLRQLVCIVPYNRTTQFLVNIQQQSLTERAHEFWKASQTQQTTTGSVFDPPPGLVRGNVFNATDAGETVLGFFGASSIYRTSILLERFRDAGFVPPGYPIAIRPGDCRTHELGATNVKPPGFK